MSEINDLLIPKRGDSGVGFKVVGDILTNMESRLKKMELEKEDAESRERGFEKRIADLERSLEMKGRIIDTLCEQIRKMEDFQARTEPRLSECNKDIIGTHMTLMKYKQENNMLGNRIDDLNKENQSTENGLDVIRLRVIDVLDEVEKNTSEAAEIKRMAIDIYGKNKEYDRNFGAVMSRMNELETAMKKVTVHWSDILSMKERIDVLEKTCDSSQN